MEGSVTDDIATSDGTVHVGVDGHVAELELDRPQRRNALSVALCGALADAFDGVAEDRDVRAVLLRGAGPTFCAGADFGDFDSGPDRGGFVPALHRLLDTMAHLRVPIVAAVHGPAIGAGCQIVAQADHVVAARGAVLGITAARIGLQLDVENVNRLVAALGPRAARRLLLFGDPLDAATAATIGLVDEVVDDGACTDVARTRAITLTQRAPLSVQGHKAAVQAVVDTWWMPPGTPQWQRVHDAGLAAFASDDLREGLAAFRERRDADFEGR